MRSISIRTSVESDVDINIGPYEIRQFFKANGITSTASRGRPSFDRAADVVRELLALVRDNVDDVDQLLMIGTLEDARGAVTLLEDMAALLSDTHVLSKSAVREAWNDNPDQHA